MTVTNLLDHKSGVLEQYDRDGYVIFPNVLDSELIAEAGEHVAWLQAKYPERRGEDLSHELVAKDAFWVRLISDPRLLEIAELFIGPDIALFASHYISKPPFSGQPVLWHQDGAYWPLDPMRVVTLWLAVDDSTTENGCLRVVPGSHKEELHELRDRDDVDSVLGSELAREVDEAMAVDLEMSKGSVDVHHPNIIHGSKANLSPNRRCGLTIRYIPTSTRILNDADAAAIHLRGELGVNSYQAKPTYVAGESFPFRGATD
jgi:phytanoyl-CoA hydroxylase